MDDAWQNQDVSTNNNGAPQNGNAGPGGSSGAPGGMHGGDMGMSNNGSGMNTDEPGWNGGGRDRDRDRERERSPPPRRSSRSRSPVRKGDDRGRPGGGVNPGNNLHVSGLPIKVDNRDLEAAFAKAGRVQKASVMYDPHSRESRGFGFVTMETPEEAEAAIVALNQQELMGKVITVEKARRGRARTPTPGRYYGPPKRREYERPYDPRPYDSRYDDYYRRPSGRDPRGDPRDDHHRSRDGDYRRDYDRDRYSSRGGGRDRYDDRRYDDRRY